jgi:hypothetical protein
LIPFLDSLLFFPWFSTSFQSQIDLDFPPSFLKHNLFYLSFLFILSILLIFCIFFLLFFFMIFFVIFFPNLSFWYAQEQPFIS